MVDLYLVALVDLEFHCIRFVMVDWELLEIINRHSHSLSALMKGAKFNCLT